MSEQATTAESCILVLTKGEMEIMRHLVRNHLQSLMVATAEPIPWSSDDLFALMGRFHFLDLLQQESPHT